VNTQHYVKALFNLDCEWSGAVPAYRIYVNDELFAERSWIWREHYLEEMLQIQAIPGKYSVRVESLDATAKFTTSDFRIGHGPAKWCNNILEILP
jgi:hypothetical protein